MTTITKTGISAFALAVALASAAAAEGDAIKIGYVTGLSGACSSISEDGLNGTKLAVEELNAKDGILGRQIELIVRDSQTKPEEGGKQARESVAAEDVDVLTGVCSPSALLAVEVVALRRVYGAPELMQLIVTVVLVLIIRAETTSAETLASAFALAARTKRSPPTWASMSRHG